LKGLAVASLALNIALALVGGVIAFLGVVAQFLAWPLAEDLALFSFVPYFVLSAVEIAVAFVFLLQLGKDLHSLSFIQRVRRFGIWYGFTCCADLVFDLLLPWFTGSVVLARTAAGAFAVFPVVENVHARGILDLSIAPARIAPALASQAVALASRLAAELDYEGVLAVEMFVVGGKLLLNEIAPRPHNSGHYTIDACRTSQFQQQVRVLCDLPLGDPSQHTPAVMVNLLGDIWRGAEPAWEAVLRHPEAHLHLYGKREVRPGRKMGHVTVCAPSLERSLAVALEIRQALGIAG